MKTLKLPIILTVIFVVFGFLLVGEIKAGTGHNVWGWAWLSNIGWISFNNTSGGGTTNYGVNINSDGILSGYAWSENIGWLTFNESELSGCPSTPCRAWLDSDNKAHGWAKALTDGGGWPGWIRLRDTNYGVWIDNSVSPAEFRNWAWSDMNIGWISFNCADRGVCLTSDYKVMTSFISNNPPSATNLSVVQPDDCLSGPAAIFSWTFTDPDSGDSQSAYQVQVDNNSNFSSPEVDSCVPSPGTCQPGNTSNSYATLPGKLSWNTTYYWRLKVWDSKDLSSSWSSGPSFITPKHAYPSINFTWSPQTPPVNQAVTFTDQSQVFGGATKISWQWTFPDGNPPSATSQNATTTFSSLGSKQVTLRVTDSDNYSCPISKSVSIQLSLPEYKEVPPVIWLKNFFAGIVEFFNGFLRSING